MPSTEAIAKGTTVRFTAGPLGLLTHFNTPLFSPNVVQVGDTGTYRGPHPHPNMDGWHIVQVGEMFCPVHDDQFEIA